MSTSNSKNPSGVEAFLAKAQSAVATELPAGSTISIGGESYTVAALADKLAHFQSFFQGAREKLSEFKALDQGRREARSELRAFVVAFRAALLGLYGETPTLETFGFTLRKQPVPLTAEQRLAKVAKLRATRAKRHTLGKRQKAPLKAEGNPVITVTGLDSAPAEPSAPEAPAAGRPAPSPAPASEPKTGSGAAPGSPSS